jgi:glycosyltransferase involved in cell wall biosynthesis
MSKAIIVSPNGLSDSGGVERVMLYASRTLETLGYRTMVVDKSFLARSSIGRTLLPLARGRLGFVVEAAAFSLLARSLKRRGDIVVANGYSSPFVRADLLFCHGSMRGFRFAVLGRRLLYSPAELMEAAAGLCARRVIAVSRRANLEWNRMYGVPRRKLRVLQNCVDPGSFAPAVGSKGRPEEECLRILYVARLGPQKAPDRLLRLIEYAAGRDLKIRFVIATPTKENTEPFERLPGVELRVGVRLQEIPDLYRSCDVLYLPSRYEGFEMVTLEALASGVPVVGSDVGGIAELSRRGFPGVSVVDPEDLEGTLSALKSAAREWASPAKKSELHARVSEEYGLSRWGTRLAAILGGRDE